MFLKEVKITKTLPCIADPRKIRFHASLDVDVSEVLPYLNSVLKGAIYNHHAHTLTIRKEGRMITIHPREIAAGKVIDEEDAREIIEWLKELINYCYENKDRIKPNFERKQKLTALEVYKLLPGTNCKRCGEPTCLAFAVKLTNEEVNIMRCPELFSGPYAERRDVLLRLLRDVGYEVPSVFLK